MVILEFKYDPMVKLAEICEHILGKTPVAVGKAGSDKLYLEFETDLTSVEETRLMKAVPKWLQDMWQLTIKQGAMIND